MAKPPQMSRREFVQIVVGALGSIMGAVIGLPAIGYLVSPALGSQDTEAWITLGKLESYPVNVPTLFNFTRTKINGWEKTVNSYGVYVVKKSEQEVQVFSNVCTHLGCRVTWKEDSKEYVCPCHDGRFNPQGIVTAGPPPKPLVTYETKIENGSISIRFKGA